MQNILCILTKRRFVFTEICVNKETVFKELFAQLREGGKSMWVRILERDTWPSK